VRSETVAIIMRLELCGNIGFLFSANIVRCLPWLRALKLALEHGGLLDRIGELVQLNLISISHNETIWRVCARMSAE